MRELDDLDAFALVARSQEGGIPSRREHEWGGLRTHVLSYEAGQNFVLCSIPELLWGAYFRKLDALKHESLY